MPFGLDRYGGASRQNEGLSATLAKSMAEKTKSNVEKSPAVAPDQQRFQQAAQDAEKEEEKAAYSKYCTLQEKRNGFGGVLDKLAQQKDALSESEAAAAIEYIKDRPAIGDIELKRNELVVALSKKAPLKTVKVVRAAADAKALEAVRSKMEAPAVPSAKPVERNQRADTEREKYLAGLRQQN